MRRPAHFLTLFVAVALGFSSTAARGQAIPDYQKAPSPFEALPNAFSDVTPFFLNASPVDHWQTYAGLTASTAALVYYDQPLLEGSQKLARRMNLISDEDSGTRSRLVWSTKIGGVNADLRVPKGANSYMYFVGDGLVSFSLISGFAAYGAIASNLRALNAASQLIESIALTGMVVITSKMTFGRESPNQRSQDGGVWRPLPGPKKYLSHISKYDAFPSGHVATAMTTVTILSLNYPDVGWILPVGYSSIGLLMFAMLNNGVHWAGDYPYGAAIGYLSAMTVFDRRKPANLRGAKPVQEQSASVDFHPMASADGVGLRLDFRIPKLGF